MGRDALVPPNRTQRGALNRRDSVRSLALLAPWRSDPGAPHSRCRKGNPSPPSENFCRRTHRLLWVGASGLHSAIDPARILGRQCDFLGRAFNLVPGAPICSHYSSVASRWFVRITWYGVPPGDTSTACATTVLGSGGSGKALRAGTIGALAGPIFAAFVARRLLAFTTSRRAWRSDESPRSLACAGAELQAPVSGPAHA